MAATITTYDALLKTRYTEKKVENLTYADRPLYAKMAKSEMSGAAMVVPLIASNPQGIAGLNLATAQTAAAGTGGQTRSLKFTLTPGTYNGTVSIDDKLIMASKDNAGSFLRAQTVEIDGLYEQMADGLATYLYGNGGGAIGRRASAASTVITLTDPSQAMNFEVGMYLQFSTGDGSSTGDAAKAGTSVVTAVDRGAGTVTVDAQIGTAADNDYIFRNGDFRGNTASDIFYGMGAYLTNGSTPAALYGMTRTSDIVRLAGAFVPSADLTGLSIEERIQKLGAYMTGRYKGQGPTDAFMNPEDWQDLAISLQSKGIRPLQDADAQFNFMNLQVVMGGKMVKIYADRFCPKGTFWALRMPNWTIYSYGKTIQPIEKDGITLLRNSTTNSYEYRLVSYSVPCTNAPGYSGRVSLT